MNGVFSLRNISSDYLKNNVKPNSNKDDAFANMFQSALNMVNETNELTKAAQEAQIDFALGKSENTHELAVAQQKASLSLQYTVSVKNKLLDAYKEIMNMQV